jgi:ribosomal protein L31E
MSVEFVIELLSSGMTVEERCLRSIRILRRMLGRRSGMKAVYCDENVAVSVVDFLHDRGHDVLLV